MGEITSDKEETFLVPHLLAYASAPGRSVTGQKLPSPRALEWVPSSVSLSGSHLRVLWPWRNPKKSRKVNEWPFKYQNIFFSFVGDMLCWDGMATHPKTEQCRANGWLTIISEFFRSPPTNPAPASNPNAFLDVFFSAALASSSSGL